MKTAIQNLWDVQKAILGGKFIAILAYSRKQETYHINNVTLKCRNQKKGNKAQGYQKKVNINYQSRNKLETKKTT